MECGWFGGYTHLVHHRLLIVLTGPVQTHQDGLDVVCGIVLQVVEKGVQQLGGLGRR